MFGIGFTELLLIAVIAILFLGPDKLPSALMEMAKFIRGIKKTIGEAKESLEQEMNVAELKKEALRYKEQLNQTTQELQGFKNIAFDEFNDIESALKYEEPKIDSSTEQKIIEKKEKITLNKKSKNSSEDNA